MRIVLLIGAGEFPLDESAAAWLASSIRNTCAFRAAGEHDEASRGCLALCRVLDDDLANGDSPEPIELGRSQIDALAACLSGAPSDDPVLTRLQLAIHRYGGGPPP